MSKKMDKKDLDIVDFYDAIKKQELKIAESLTKGYRSNHMIKRSGEEIEWTEELIQEYAKCKNDPIYFIENYIKIISFDGLTTLKLYPYQKEMVENIHNNRFNIITTARQSGKSTTLCSYLLWFVIFNNDKTVALLANKGSTAREIFSRVRLSYQYLPKWLQQGISEGGWNKGSLELENNSRILAESSSSENIRGYTIDFLFIDECAFVDNWDDFAQSVLPTITSDPLHRKKVCFVSTPNGMNHFHDYWQAAKQGTNGYKYIEVTWDQVPGRDESWKEETLKLLNHDVQKFAQENECAFQGSSGTLIAGWKLEKLIQNKVVNPLTDDGYTKQYMEPIEGHVYIMVADVSRGIGSDYHAFSVVDVTEIPNRVVCSFRSNIINVIDYSSILNHIGLLYNKAYIMVELNDIGGQAADQLFNEHEYENILYTESRGRNGKRITGKAGEKIDRGIRTTKTVKSAGCAMLKMLLEQDKLIVEDPITIQELTTFSKKGLSYEAETGKHDDTVMTLVLFAWITMDPFFGSMTDVDLIQALKEKTEEQLENEMIPFGVISTGREEPKFDPDFGEFVEYVDMSEYFGF